MSLPILPPFVLGLLALCPVVAQAKIERVIEKTFAVSPGGSLRIDTRGGEIRVTPSSESMVKVTAREKIRASTEAEADELLKKLELTIEQSGNDVTAIARYEKQSVGFHFGAWPPVTVDFIVSVPASFVTDLHTSGGGITVGDMAGRVSAHTSGGSIKLGQIGAAVKARTSGGNITVGRVAGPAELSTSGGGIKIESVQHAVHARTSGGSIRANIAGPLKEDCVLSTSGGSVQVAVERSAAFQLDASTSGGSVDAEGLTITIGSSSRGRSKLAGSVNGGGPLLKLRSSGGGIVIRPE